MGAVNMIRTTQLTTKPLHVDSLARGERGTMIVK